jgi:hypothetical protein
MCSFTKNNNISLQDVKQKTTNWYIETKLKIIFSRFFKKENITTKIIDKFIKSRKNSIFFKKFKINYVFTFFKKVKNEVFSNVCELNITLAKKQTYVSTVINNNKNSHLTNGIMLKQISILEKCRKKDSKVSVLTVSNSTNNFKKKLTKDALVLLKIKKIKPFINKISKLVINDLKSVSRNLFIIIKPSMNFNFSSFKKIKSIKRRLRKKYKTIDL